MFCSSCSRSINPGLSYCNHCGARAPGKGDERPAGLSSFSFNFLVLGLLLVPLAGGGLIIAFVANCYEERAWLWRRHDRPDRFYVIRSFADRRARSYLAPMAKFADTARVTDVRQTAITGTPDVIIKGLPEIRVDPIFQPVPSVIEHTTNMLDSVPRKTTERDLS